MEGIAVDMQSARENVILGAAFARKRHSVLLYTTL